MSFALADTIRQKGTALATLLVWLVALHICLLGNAGLTASFCETSHHASAGDCHGSESHEDPGHDDPQNHQEEDDQKDDDCCDELAVACISNERISPVSAMLLSDDGPETACASRFPTEDAAEAVLPALWPPGESFFTSKIVGSSLFGRGPPVIR